MARFRVDHVVHITGRGTCICGEIVEGRFRVEDWIVTPVSVAPLHVIGIGFADNIETHEYRVDFADRGPTARATRGAAEAGARCWYGSRTQV